MKKYIISFLLLIMCCQSQASSDDSKTPFSALNPFDENVTSAIREAHKKRKAEQQKKKKEEAAAIIIQESHSINGPSHAPAQPPVYKKKCFPEWCSDFCLPLTMLLCVGLIGGGACYCKATSSCLGYESDGSANSTITNNGTQALPLSMPTPLRFAPPAHQVSLKALLNTRTHHSRRKRERKFQLFEYKKKR
jgi:hypothetical protein